MRGLIVTAIIIVLLVEVIWLLATPRQINEGTELAPVFTGYLPPPEK
jgi:hypothetical protein